MFHTRGSPLVAASVQVPPPDGTYRRLTLARPLPPSDAKGLTLTSPRTHESSTGNTGASEGPELSTTIVTVELVEVFVARSVAIAWIAQVSSSAAVVVHVELNEPADPVTVPPIEPNAMPPFKPSNTTEESPAVASLETARQYALRSDLLRG